MPGSFAPILQAIHSISGPHSMVFIYHLAPASRIGGRVAMLQLANHAMSAQPLDLARR